MHTRTTILGAFARELEEKCHFKFLPDDFGDFRRRRGPEEAKSSESTPGIKGKVPLL